MLVKFMELKRFNFIYNFKFNRNRSSGNLAVLQNLDVCGSLLFRYRYFR